MGVMKRMQHNYRKPSYAVAEKMCNDIIRLLQKCGKPYNVVENYVIEHILICIATGQFFYRKDKYFVCWFMVDEPGAALLNDHARPNNITDGNTMYIAECGCLEGMGEIRRKIHKKVRGGVFWHRCGAGWKVFKRSRSLDRRDDRSGGKLWVTTAPAAPAHP